MPEYPGYAASGYMTKEEFDTMHGMDRPELSENVARDQPQNVDDVLSELAGVQKTIDQQQKRKNELIELYHKYQEVQTMKFAEIVDRSKLAEPGRSY